MIRYCQLLTVACLLGQTRAECDNKVPPAIKLENGITRKLYYQQFHEVNGHCIELNLVDVSVSSTSIVAEVIKGQDAIQIEPLVCLSESRGYSVTATFTSDEECFEDVKRTVTTSLNFVNDMKFPCAQYMMPSYSLYAGVDEEYYWDLPFFMQNETITDYKVKNKPSWLQFEEDLDWRMNMTAKANIKKSGTYNMAMQLYVNETKWQELPFTITVYKEKDWTVGFENDHLFRLRVQGVQHISDSVMAARFAFTEPRTLITQADKVKAAAGFSRGMDIEIFKEKTGEECLFTMAVLDIDAQGFSVLFTENEPDDRRVLHSDGDHPHHVHIEEDVADCFKSLDKLRLVVDVEDDNGYWVTEEGGVLMRDYYIFHLKNEHRTKEFSECKDFREHKDNVFDLFDEDIVTMFPGSYYTVKMFDNFRENLCSRIYDYTVTDTGRSSSTSASIDFDNFEMRINVGSEPTETWFYVEVNIRAQGNFDRRYAQMRVRVVAAHEPLWIRDLTTIDVPQYGSYKNFEFPQLSQDGTFDFISVSEQGIGSGAYCKNDYTALKIKGKKVSLIDAHNTGTYSVFVRVKGHNGVYKNSLTELRFRVVSNSINYWISMVQPASTVSLSSTGGEFEVSFNNTYQFMEYEEAFPNFLSSFTLDNSYSAITEFTEQGFKGKIYYVPSGKVVNLKVGNYRSGSILNYDDPENILGLQAGTVTITTSTSSMASLDSTESSCLSGLVSRLYRGNSQAELDEFYENVIDEGYALNTQAACTAQRDVLNLYLYQHGYDIDLSKNSLDVSNLLWQVPKKRKSIKSTGLSGDGEIDIYDMEGLNEHDAEFIVETYQAGTIISETNKLSRKQMRGSKYLAISEALVDALEESSWTIESKLNTYDDEEEEKTAVSSAFIAISGTGSVVASFFGAGGLMGPAIGQAQVFSALSMSDSDQEGNFAPAISAQKATYRTEEKDTYERLNIALKERKRLDGKYDIEGPRNLQVVDDHNKGDEVAVPFDFYEAVIPTFILFVLMLIFFGIVAVLKKVVGHPKLEPIMEDFKWNSFVRFALIFYLPLQIACIGTFKDITFADEIEDVIQLILAIVLQVVLVLFIAVVFKTIKEAAADPRIELNKKTSTLFYDLNNEKKAFYYHAIFLIHKMLLSLTIALPDDIEIRIWTSLIVQLLFFIFVTGTRPFKMALQSAVVALSEFLILIAIFILYARSEEEDKDAMNGLFLFIFLLVIVLNIAFSIFKLVKGDKIGQVKVIKQSNNSTIKDSARSIQSNSGKTKDEEGSVWQTSKDGPASSSTGKKGQK